MGRHSEVRHLPRSEEEGPNRGEGQESVGDYPQRKRGFGTGKLAFCEWLPQKDKQLCLGFVDSSLLFESPSAFVPVSNGSTHCSICTISVAGAAIPPCYDE